MNGLITRSVETSIGWLALRFGKPAFHYKGQIIGYFNENTRQGIKISLDIAENQKLFRFFPDLRLQQYPTLSKGDRIEYLGFIVGATNISILRPEEIKGHKQVKIGTAGILEETNGCPPQISRNVVY